MYDSQSSQLMPMHYRHGFHSRLADHNRLLRYFLGIIVASYQSADMRGYEIHADERGLDTRARHFCSPLHVTMKVGLYHQPRYG